MTFREKARAKVKELDERMAELNAMLDENIDPEQKEAIVDEILSVAALTNKYLRIAGADESEMYDI
ncbi:MAG: hypothetical protein J5548_15025 [Prevotella sp.]|nr:hypothetical protein [Prevotella sp.]